MNAAKPYLKIKKNEKIIIAIHDASTQKNPEAWLEINCYSLVVCL